MVRLGAYAEPLDGWLLRIKRRSWHAMAESLGDLLAEQCRAVWGDSAFDAVAPIPMPTLRRIWRGIDHSAALAARIARAFRVPLVRPLVHQGGRTQVGRSRTERLRRASPFQLHPAAVKRCRRFGTVLLVDDVCSTGATVRQASRVLGECPGIHAVKVAVAAIAESFVRDQANSPPKTLDSRTETE